MFKDCCLESCINWNVCDELDILKYMKIQLSYTEEKNWCPCLTFPNHLVTEDVLKEE